MPKKADLGCETPSIAQNGGYVTLGSIINNIAPDPKDKRVLSQTS
jgi:hypothetical protein